MVRVLWVKNEKKRKRAADQQTTNKRNVCWIQIIVIFSNGVFEYAENGEHKQTIKRKQ